MNSQERIVGKQGIFICESKIGEGSFATVMRGHWEEQNKPVAIKVQQNLKNIYQIIDKRITQKQVIRYIQKEIEILEIMSREQSTNNIIRMYDSFETDNLIYIILELADMDLSKFWKHYGKKIPENLVMTSIFPQILSAFKSLHQNKILHRDIKLENIVVFMRNQKLENISKSRLKNVTFKLTDFGLGKIFLNGEKQETDTFLGSPLTMGSLLKQYYDKLLKSSNQNLTEQKPTYFPWDAFYFSCQKEDSHIFKNMELIILKKLKMETWNLMKILLKMLKYNPEQRLNWQELYDLMINLIDKKSQISSFSAVQIRVDSKFYKNIQEQQNNYQQEEEEFKSNKLNIRDNNSTLINDQNLRKNYEDIFDEIIIQRNRYQLILDSCEIVNSKVKYQITPLIYHYIKQLSELIEMDTSIYTELQNDEYFKFIKDQVQMDIKLIKEQNLYPIDINQIPEKIEQEIRNVFVRQKSQSSQEQIKIYEQLICLLKIKYLQTPKWENILQMIILFDEDYENQKKQIKNPDVLLEVIQQFYTQYDLLSQY